MDTTLKIVFSVIIVILITLSAFFSAAETSYSSLSVAKLERGIKKKEKWALLVKKQYKSFGWTLATILLANNLVNVGLSSLATYMITSMFSSSATTTIISTAIVTPILVIFGEIFPKLLAKKYPLSYLKKITFILQALNYLFFPITYPLSKITLQSKVTNSEKDIKNIINLARVERALGVNEAVIAERALEIDSKPVKSVMTLKKNIISIDANKNVASAKKIFMESGHSRILVTKDDKYIGFIILKDIIFMKDKEKLGDLIQELPSVSKSSLISKALEQMRINKKHMAIVTENQKSKKVVGLITIEDIVELIFGEIYDEHDEEAYMIREIAHYKYISLGSAKMENLSKLLSVDFEEKEEKTVKQWLQGRIKRKISKGLRYEYNNQVIFKILKNKNNQETQIQIVKKISE